MSLNWREIELILSELSLEGCLVQKVIQNSFHSITWMLYDKSRGSFALYTEVGTPQSRICLAENEIAKTKTEKLQRFVQFARANIEGARVVGLMQKPGDREVTIELIRQQPMFICIRLFSGPGANIIVTDSEHRIMDLLYRRPKRNEISGAILQESPQSANPREFAIRDRIEGMTFNEQINTQFSNESQEDQLSDIKAKLQLQLDRLTSHELGTISSLRKSIDENSGWEELRHIGDLLAANLHRIQPRQTSIEIDDYDNGNKRLVVLDPSHKGSQHIESYYEKSKKARGTLENAQTELKQAEARLAGIQAEYSELLKPTGDDKADLRRMKGALKNCIPIQSKPQNQVGIICRSNSFEIVIGRTAKENDKLLRHGFKGNDYWFHTRDFPGAYVFVRCPRNKTVPLETMLDAANLAALYSEGKNNSKVNLYYTQVKYLRRVKNGPLGLVIPSQEKNLTITVDRKRAQAILEGKEKDID